MLKSIKKQMNVQKMDYILMMCFVLVGFVAGKLIFALIVFLDSSTDQYFALGTVIAAVMACVYAGIMGIVQLQQYFNIQISMGSTRKHFFVSHYLIAFLMNLLAGVMLILVNLLENVMNSWIYHGWEQEIELLPYVAKGVLPAAFAVTIVSGFCGAMVMKFGKKASVVLWFLWMFGCLGVPHIHDAAAEAPDSVFGMLGNTVGNLFTGVSPMFWLALGAVLVLAAFLGIWLVLRRQQVMN